MIRALARILKVYGSNASVNNHVSSVSPDTIRARILTVSTETTLKLKESQGTN